MWLHISSEKYYDYLWYWTGKELSTYVYFKTQVKVCYLTIQKLLRSEFAFM